MSVHVAKHGALRVLISRLLGQIVKKPRTVGWGEYNEPQHVCLWRWRLCWGS